MRLKRGRRCDLRPAAPAGWAITLLYVAAAAGMSYYFVGRAEPALPAIIAWAVLLAAATFLYLLVAWRTAVTVTRESKGCGGNRSPRADTRRTLLFALAGAAAILGAALAGIEL